MAGRLGVAAQLMGRLDGHALAARLQFLLAPVGEQAGGQAELADGAEPGQLVAQAGDAGATRAGAQVDERSVHPPFRRRLVFGSAVAALRASCLQQGVEPVAHFGRQPSVDRSETPVVVRAHRVAHNVCDAVGGGWLDVQCTAPGFGLRGEPGDVPGFGRGGVAQPRAEVLGVGDRRFPEAEQGAYLGPLPLERAVVVGQQRRPAAGRRHAQRA